MAKSQVIENQILTLIIVRHGLHPDCASVRPSVCLTKLKTKRHRKPEVNVMVV